MDYSEIAVTLKKVRAENLAMAQDVIVDGQVVISEAEMLQTIAPLDEALDHLSSLNS